MPSQNSSARYGDPMNMKQQAAGLFATHLKRNNKLSHMVGKMPQGEAGAIETVKRQSTQHLPFVRSMDLGKGKGDEVTFNLVNPFGAVPIMGSENAEGRGEGLSLSEDRLRVNQARFPINLGDNMTGIRSPADFRKLGRPVAQSVMDRYIDQLYIVHAAGARGSVDNLTWSIPLETDARFNDVVLNPIKAPSKNRHFVASGNYVTEVVPNSTALTITTSDVLSMNVIDSMRAVMDEMIMPPPIVKFEGDEAADDEPLRVMLVTPLQYNSLARDTNFRTVLSAAHARASNAKQHPIFRGEVGLWNNFLIVKQNVPIRFFAGDSYKYCTDHRGTEGSLTIPTLTSGTVQYAVDRAIILGGQAVGHALARHDKSGLPFFWSEKEMDHGDKVELLIGTVHGVSKFRFDINMGDEKQVTDYGVTILDTAVPLNKA